MELDHLFIVTRDDGFGASSKARAARMSEALTEAGLTEAFARIHVGQGTANHRFQFDNVMLELLYVHDRAELSVPPTTALQLEARFEDAEASPFGICSRPSDARESDAAYPYSVYKPAYLPPHLAIQFADALPATEPLWFHLPFAGQPEAVDHEPGAHPSGLRRVKGVHIETRHRISARSVSIAEQLQIEITLSQRDHMHLHFELPLPEQHGGCLTPDSELPLSLHW